MKKPMKIMCISLGVVFGAIIAFNLFKGFMMKRFFAHFTPPAVTVSSVTAIQRPWEPQIHAVGNFVAVNGVNVTPEVAGSVVAIHFDSGQYVEKNTPLIDMDDTVDLAILKSNLSELTLQELNYQRQLDLSKHGATPKSSVDEANAKLLQARAAVEKTEALIRQKHILAPFSGQLGIRLISLGEYITPGQTAIAALQSMDPIYLEFYLPEQMFKHLHINQELTFTISENPNLVFKGKISAINSKIDINTHNILVQATLPNCDVEALKSLKPPLIKVSPIPNSTKKLITCNTSLNTKHHVENFNFIPGMFAAINIKEPPLPNVIVLPTTAISYSLYGNSVYIIEQDKTQKDVLTVKRTFVVTGDQEGNNTIILKGVKPGQQVVSSGELKLQDGTSVVINNDVKLVDVDDLNHLGE